jgi:hypothetical protein
MNKKRIPWEWIFWLAVIVAITVIFPYFRAKAAGNCGAINTNRAEGNKRARVIKEFLLDAAAARSFSAQHETGALKLNDQRFARRYRVLAGEIHELPIRGC